MDPKVLLGDARSVVVLPLAEDERLPLMAGMGQSKTSTSEEILGNGVGDVGHDNDER